MSPENKTRLAGAGKALGCGFLAGFCLLGANLWAKDSFAGIAQTLLGKKVEPKFNFTVETTSAVDGKTPVTIDV